MQAGVHAGADTLTNPSKPCRQALSKRLARRLAHRGRGRTLRGSRVRNRDDEFGVKLMWTPDEIRFGLSSDTSIDMLTRAELLGLRSSIDKALLAEEKLTD
ncbi:hypothetical protein GCM10009696_32760 [Kocuria himachalensis]